MIYLLHLVFGWITLYPLSAIILDTVIITLALVTIILFLLARFKGLRWETGKR